MAKAIRQIERIESNVKEERAEDLSAILNKIADNREAIEEAIEIIEELHNAEVLPALKAILKTRQKVGAIAIEQINQPGMHNVIKNAMTMFTLLASIDSAQLQQLAGGLTEGVEKASESTKQTEDASLWSLLKATKDPNVKRSLNMMINFLNGMGEGLAKKQSH
ncbi:DUF1641 domain-containing protein [Gracilibacillus oryzae]|uniref:DUF1641 domain-containing protein n=1 Tax=Gracilibacillus oryzae TaxID=1672701 RepID=A0A7C8KPG6_9BACI|nr:DUF1641 domain-containing protein [Gracilibacillus oryzae]KAB8125540.1 DUF1641 domain-containing protein [Gracilibacillus oryzae]